MVISPNAGQAPHLSNLHYAVRRDKTPRHRELEEKPNIATIRHQLLRLHNPMQVATTELSEHTFTVPVFMISLVILLSTFSKDILERPKD